METFKLLTINLVKTFIISGIVIGCILNFIIQPFLIDTLGCFEIGFIYSFGLTLCVSSVYLNLINKVRKNIFFRILSFFSTILLLITLVILRKLKNPESLNIHESFFEIGSFLVIHSYYFMKFNSSLGKNL
jgi:hypothetical protein